MNTSSSVKRFSTSSTSNSNSSSSVTSPSPKSPVSTLQPTNNNNNNLMNEERVYTEQGFDFNFKRRAYDHWDRLFASEGTSITPPEKFFAVSRYAEIWSEVALRPASLEPLNDVERQAISSGVFHHLARRTGGVQQHHTNAPRGGRGGFNGGRRAFPPRNHPISNSKQEEDEGPVLWAEESVTPLSGSIDSQGVFHSDKPSVSSPSIEVAPPGFTKEEEILWYYKDPKGNEQGPFTSQVMLDWYHRKFFTDSLPLRSHKDVMFEPLGYWRVKHGGKVPFEDLKTATPEVVSFGTVASAVPQEEETVVIKKEIITPIGRPSSPIVSSTTNNNSFTTNSSTAAITVSAAVTPSATITSPTLISPAKKIDVNALFNSSTSLGRPSSKSVSSESLEVANNTIDATPTLANSKSNFTKNNNTTSNTKKETPLVIKEASWNSLVSGNSAPTLKSIIEEQQQQQQPPKPIESPPIIGWKKVGEASASKPLSSIIKEETKMKPSNEATQSKKSGPLTFADLVKSMGNSSISTEPVVPATPKIIQRPINNNATKSNTTSAAAVGVIQKPSPLKDWCMNELSPLKTVLDLNTAVTLLLDIKSAGEAAAFIRDNLNPSLVDLALFGREFVKRKFNKELPAYSFIPQPLEDEEQPFEQVQRRRK